jgi:hypothetical protein
MEGKKGCEFERSLFYLDDMNTLAEAGEGPSPSRLKQN